MLIEDINEPDIYVLLQLGMQGKDICLIVKNMDSCALENLSLSELFLYNHIKSYWCLAGIIWKEKGIFNKNYNTLI